MSEDFRATARAWLEANCPDEMREPITHEKQLCWGGRRWKFASDAQRVWLERMGSRGWTVPEWPVQYGGGGLTREQAEILREETRRLRCRTPLSSFGISMLGPALLKYGSEAQKREHLPRIARGEIRWCQGYSEPGAGSDLAALKTRAEDRGDHFLVNGEKVWTSYADEADWIFCLVRTDSSAPKHKGISFLLFDMESEGVSTQPIKLISGKSPFCQILFANVRVPKPNLVGTLNGGWEIAKYLLTHEREMIGGIESKAGGPGTLCARAVQEIGLADGRLADDFLRSELARYEIDSLAFGETMRRINEQSEAGQGTGALSSMLKYYGTELNKRRQELAMSILGSHGLAWESETDGDAARSWLRSKGNSIEGGTSEIQLNIIAKHVLRLP
ncbi:MAG: acyl-CoA dehydrogenase family protein [Steroidobacteraceae bacterium]